ncbi:hypothetical protein PtA15_15A203 [Puccinia triticina]|uniref:Uncharacterized protein n=1 Tax=Puccinia triticina TaxID=208348 RepID=A0ABY7D4S7_9BASI|nr:uncharacterized protein PtA15_15A201 [Puccinia triticina]XP_053027366.1 uncharacterized protein PtA15_15A203 [Puccinia triticina]WAQ91809.1 hypothetical protein PtA15_15A201 [Puccinia triticina]WAQ91811.1 hypothetical protein PtA15_15A203 [Puccinia triticina]
MTVREVLGHLSDEPLDRVQAVYLDEPNPSLTYNTGPDPSSDSAPPPSLLFPPADQVMAAQAPEGSLTTFWDAGRKQLNSNNNGLDRYDNNDELDRDGDQGSLTGWTETETKEAGGLISRDKRPMTMTSPLLSADLVIGSSALLSGLLMSYNCGLTEAMTHAEFNLSNLWISAFGVWISHLSLCCRRSKPQNQQKTFRTS